MYTDLPDGIESSIKPRFIALGVDEVLRRCPTQHCVNTRRNVTLIPDALLRHRLTQRYVYTPKVILNDKMFFKFYELR